MKKRISMFVLTGLFTATTVQASGFRIPEQSVDSTAKAAANIASATRADAAYFNPANMSYMEDRWMVQGNISYIHLTSIEYDDNRIGFPSTASEDENFAIPTFFAVSPFYGNFRFGISSITPNGLSKRWREAGTFGEIMSNQFSLQTFELNPTVSYRVTDNVSIAGGVRALYAKAKLVNALFDLAGDTVEWGWNLALAVQPWDNVNFSVTYRSLIDMNFSVDDAGFVAARRFGGLLPLVGAASTTVPSPAVLAVSTSFKPVDKLTVELTWDRTFWSQYDSLRIENAAEGFFVPVIPGVVNGNPYTGFESIKDWKDRDAFRLGLSYEYSDKLTLLGGLAYDQNPVPDVHLGYELPDSDAWIISAGFQYAYTENLEFGVGVLYDYKERRNTTSDVVVGGASVVDGEFSNASAWFVTVGVNYKF